MTRQSTAKRLPYSASNALQALAKALNEIKATDDLTFGDIGAVLGKSEDQAAKYADGTTDMGVVSFGRAKEKWGKRFTLHFDDLCGDVSDAVGNDRRALTAVVRATQAIAEALENDDHIDADEVLANLPALTAAFDALGSLLRKVPAGRLGVAA